MMWHYANKCITWELEKHTLDEPRNSSSCPGHLDSNTKGELTWAILQGKAGGVSLIILYSVLELAVLWRMDSSPSPSCPHLPSPARDLQVCVSTLSWYSIRNFCVRQPLYQQSYSPALSNHLPEPFNFCWQSEHRRVKENATAFLRP